MAHAVADPPAEERWGDDGREQHDEEQRPVELVVEDALCESDAGEDQADLATGDHADADEQPVGPRALYAVRRHQLPGDGDGEQDRGVEQHGRLQHRPEVGVHADEDEEDGDQNAADAVQVGGDALLVLTATEGKAGDERSDDRRELREVGEHREAEDDRRATTVSVVPERAEPSTMRRRRGTRRTPRTVAPTTKANATSTVGATTPTVTASPSTTLTTTVRW